MKWLFPVILLVLLVAPAVATLQPSTVYNMTPHNQVGEDFFNMSSSREWLFNLSDEGDLRIFDLARSTTAPYVNVFGWYFISIIYFVYILVVWIKSRSMILPLVLGIITLPITSVIFPMDIAALVLNVVVVGFAAILTLIKKE